MATAKKKKKAPRAKRQYTLEEGVRLSESLIWNLQRAYYNKEGIEAWKSGTVPSYITTNAFIAGAYARVLHAHLIDVAREAEGEAPTVHIIELGAGHGRFGFLVLKKLTQLLKLSPAKAAPFCYVMTDLVEKNVAFWGSHSFLKPFIDRGLLDFACYDVEKDTELKLKLSSKTISAENRTQSMAVIANYVFDSLTVDVFQVAEGQLRESLITVKSTKRSEKDLDDPAVIDRISVAYQHQEVDGDTYDVPELNRILRIYSELLGDTSFLLPIGTLRGIRTLEDMCDGQMLILSADKGYNHAHQLLGQSPPSLVKHGSFSFSVNYHAIGLYFRERGGFSLHTSERSGSIEVSAFVLKGTPADNHQTCLSFQREVEDLGPVDFFLLQRDANKLEGTPSLEYCLSLLRLSGWDPEIFYDLRIYMRDQAEAAHSDTQQEVARAMAKVWDLFYFLGNDRDVPFAMGRIFHRMGQYHQAIHYYQHSVRLLGDDRATFYNIGLCHYKVGQSAAALHYFDKSLEVDATYSFARDWKLRVQAEMRKSGASWDATSTP